MSEELQQRMVRPDADAIVLSSLIPTKGDNEQVLLAKLLASLNKSGRSGVIIDEGGVPQAVKRAIVNQAASGSAVQFVAAVTGKRIRVISVYALTGGTATDLTFLSNSTAISPLLANDVKGGEVLPRNVDGWFETVAGEALKLTTSAGSTTGIGISYILVPNYVTDENGIVLTDEAGNPLLAE